LYSIAKTDPHPNFATTNLSPALRLRVFDGIIVSVLKLARRQHCGASRI
jgi:hypothetical protein